MSGTSSVGQASVYEAGDQRNVKKSELETAERYNEGKENSHKSTDSSRIVPLFIHRSLANPKCQRTSVLLPTDWQTRRFAIFIVRKVVICLQGGASRKRVEKARIARKRRC